MVLTVFQVAVQRGIPILRPEWLFACWKNHAVAGLQDYIVASLSGFIICVTGLSASTRQTIQRLVAQNGGSYSPDLTRKVLLFFLAHELTYLVYAPPCRVSFGQQISIRRFLGNSRGSY